MMRWWIGLLGCLLAGHVFAAPCATVIKGQAASVSVPGYPYAVTSSADGCFLFVSLTRGPQPGLAVLENKGGEFQLARTVPFGLRPSGMTLTPDGATLIVAAADSVVLLDVAKLRSGDADPIVTRLPQEPTASAINLGLTPDGSTLFVTDESDGWLDVVDFATLTKTGQIVLGSAPVGLAFTKDGERLYATAQSAPAALNFPITCPAQGAGVGPKQGQAVLYTIDVAKARTDPAHAVIAASPSGCEAVRVALSPDGSSAWVTARASNALLRFATTALASDNAKADQVAVGPLPVAIAVSADGQHVWVSNSNRAEGPGGVGSLSLIQAAAGAPLKVVTTIPAGSFPRDLYFLPDGKTLVSTEFNSQRVVFIAPLAPDS